MIGEPLNASSLRIIEKDNSRKFYFSYLYLTNMKFISVFIFSLLTVITGYVFAVLICWKGLRSFAPSKVA